MILFLTEINEINYNNKKFKTYLLLKWPNFPFLMLKIRILNRVKIRFRSWYVYEYSALFHRQKSGTGL